MGYDRVDAGIFEMAMLQVESSCSNCCIVNFGFSGLNCNNGGIGNGVAGGEGDPRVIGSVESSSCMQKVSKSNNLRKSIFTYNAPDIFILVPIVCVAFSFAFASIIRPRLFVLTAYKTKN
jgi:hypothetical protein